MADYITWYDLLANGILLILCILVGYQAFKHRGQPDEEHRAVFHAIVKSSNNHARPDGFVDLDRYEQLMFNTHARLTPEELNNGYFMEDATLYLTTEHYELPGYNVAGALVVTPDLIQWQLEADNG